MGGADSAIRVKGLSGSSRVQYQLVQGHRWLVEGGNPARPGRSEFTPLCPAAWLLTSLGPRSQLFAFYISSYTLQFTL